MPKTTRHTRLGLILALPFLATSAQKAPDLGPNVLLITPSTPIAEAQARINAIYATQQHNEFGSERNAILFTPGTYHLDIPIGFYTEVEGVGFSPLDTHVVGNVHVDAASRNDNATTTFWRALENLDVVPAGGKMQWAVSQATVLRRMHIGGDLVLNQNKGWASGGWMADTMVDGTVNSGTQQQWISRNSEWKNWTGSNWNMVFVGVRNAPPNSWPKPAYTTIEYAPVRAEKPFLFVDGHGKWQVWVPGHSTGNTIGVSWLDPQKRGAAVPLDRFYIAHAGRDTALTINAALDAGKSLLFTPGIYPLTQSLRVTHKNTVVLGLGYATLQPVSGLPAMTTDDAEGISIAGILFDAGPVKSPTLLRVGPQSATGPRNSSTLLSDVFFRVGGAGPGQVDSNLEINSPDTVVDHTWIWRADHGHNVGWDQNLSRNGLVVNGDRVTIYGLFVEHHQQYQVLWNGNAGRTYFYQSEIPYDPPTQAAYASAPATDGWASYKLGPTVTTHEAWGLGIYSVFTHPDIFVTRAIEAPQLPGIRFHDIITVCLANKGGIRNVIDNTGGSTSCGSRRVEPRLTNFPPTAPAQ